MKLALLSDTHNKHKNIVIPPVDVAIHCGDATMRGTPKELRAFAEWYRVQPAKHHIYVAGNHDWCTYKGYVAEIQAMLAATGILYLEESEVTIDGVRFYGSPWVPQFFDWAWMLDRGPQMKAVWDRIPVGIDVLITHGPPEGKLDWSNYDQRSSGCAELRAAVSRIRPRLHCFGHMHGCYGGLAFGETAFINCCICDEDYKPVREPIIFDLEVSNEQADQVVLDRL